MKTKIFIYDDSEERRDSLKNLLMLHDDYVCVGDGPNCLNVLRDMAAHQPKVVLMDISMPELDGLEGLKLIKSKYPEIAVLMQTAFDDDDRVFKSITNGANGYILKTDSPSRIMQAIAEVLEGGAAMNPAIAQKVLAYFKPKTRTTNLSEKEIEVLSFLAEGLSYKMVADKMAITYSTVNTYAKRIYEKLHISSLGEAISYFYKNLK